jgi:hypothetical protein
VLAKMYKHFLGGLTFLVAIGPNQLEVIVLSAPDASDVDCAPSCSN